MSECITLTALGGRCRSPCFTREGYQVPRLVPLTVMCWWCREYHLAAEVGSCMALPRKATATANGQSSGSVALQPGLLTSFSELWAFLTETKYPDGSKRQTGRLSLSCDVDLLGLTLNDDDNGQYAHLSGRGVDDLLAEAELRLADGTLVFRPSRWAKKGK